MAAHSPTAAGSAVELELRSPKGGQEHSLRLPADREYVIGRDELAVVIIDDPGLLPRHARLFPSPDGVFIEPLSDAAIHDPPLLLRDKLGYPQPIVDHAVARKRALAEFEQAKA